MSTKVEPSAFQGFLSEQRRGLLEADLSMGLSEVVKASVETGKVGKMSITLTVKPTGEGMVTVTDEIKATVPKHDTQPSVFFTDTDGSLHRENANQMNIAGDV